VLILSCTNKEIKGEKEISACTWKKPHSSQALVSCNISLLYSSLLPLTSLEKSMMGTVSGGCRAVASVGLSVMSLTNLSGIVAGLAFLSSWTSSIWPTLIGEMGTGAMETEFGNVSKN